ncbi:HAD-IIIC family phosphatase [Lichenicoccus roseus]|uniref:HAD-IIIC family phosphatase n=1 Tax=Lichenicoccus roseus TaxID=2683649 RepID=A0A5R9J289_9PROT|nr:HAD-IIIC family phosphatase [Lichenicoccus roseus]TLU70597.1 HAD-IIIC family phosphatase [Lichenicoccus roseus]
MALANERLDHLKTVKLDRRLRKLFPDEPPKGIPTVPVRLAILSSSTVDHLLPSLRVGALRHGIWLGTQLGDYGQYAQELQDPAAAIHQYRPTCVLFAFDARHMLRGIDVTAGADEAEAWLEATVADLARHWQLGRQQFDCKVIQQTILPVFPTLFGNNEQRLPGSAAALLSRLNQRLRASADAHGIELLAIDEQATQDGLQTWYDPALWHRGKQEVHPNATPVYGDMLGRLLAAYQGRSRKCLVLDLDNTLWGGVIGDDGLTGILIGNGNSVGEAFIEFQSYARALSRRGIILAVCSKNDEKNALEPFEKHPEMVLKRNDIACFVANWSDKASNIREIAQRLNIGLDSLVFVDDNPFEREIVRRELPMVAVPEIPEDPALYSRVVAAAGYFEGVHLTAEDRERTAQYQATLQRNSLAATVTDLPSYLRSLEMRMVWTRFDTIGLQRIVQLVNKTNQFNLTTRRTTTEEVEHIIADPRSLSLQMRLIDRFGDNGIISIIAGSLAGGGGIGADLGGPQAGPGDIVLHTWLMSCRVLGRGVEQAALDLVIAEGKRLQARRLIGVYKPTPKNDMTRRLYAELGFAALEPEGDIERWVLQLDGAEPKPTSIQIIEG